MSARTEVLARVRRALGDVPAGSGPEEVPVPRGYARAPQLPDVLGLFAERVADYRAVVQRVREEEVAGAVDAALQRVGARRVVVPGGVPQAWLAAATDAGVQIVRDDPPLSAVQLDELDAVVTGAAVGIAITGTIVMDHGPTQGRRALTLVPDVHVCIVTAEQVVADVTAGVERLAAAVRECRPLTWVSGPSATSDIELDRVEGVHGPRTLHVLVVGGGSP